MDRRADGDYKKVASFAAVLPAEDPEILVYVMLDDPNNARTDYSSVLAAPVVGNIISERPLSGHPYRRRGPQRHHGQGAQPISKEWSNAQVSLNIKGLSHQLMESETTRPPPWSPISTPVQVPRWPMAPRSICIPTPTRAAAPRCRMSAAEKCGLCPPDAGRSRLELRGRGQRHGPEPKCPGGRERPAGHHCHHHLRVKKREGN